MKDSEFMELLNLYLDHEISAADAARLEAEVQNNPARRQIYREYCRMQKGCALVAQDFQTEQPPATDRKVVAFEAANRRSRMASLYTVGTFAAAACIAIVLVSRNREASGQDAAAQVPAIAQTAPTNSASEKPNSTIAANSQVPSALVQTVSLPTRTSQPSSAATNPLSLAANAQADALAAAVEEANAQFAWLRNTQVSPMQQPVSLDQLRFESQPGLRVENRTYGSRQPVQGTAEWVAFRFQR
jgi:predicted anti-sigma-YlaC factor YlaD